MHEIAQLHSRTWRIRGCIFSQRQLAAGEAERTAGYSIEERTLEMMMMVKRRWSHSPLVVGTTRALQDSDFCPCFCRELERLGKGGGTHAEGEPVQPAAPVVAAASLAAFS